MKDNHLWWYDDQLAIGFRNMQKRVNPNVFRRMIDAILRRK